MTDKIKLEDMTLKQIRDIKDDYEYRVKKALTAIQNEFMEKYDCGFPLVEVTTEVKSDAYKAASGMILLSKVWHEYNIRIYFSREYD